jgi:hypothetical protein
MEQLGRCHEHGTRDGRRRPPKADGSEEPAAAKPAKESKMKWPRRCRAARSGRVVRLKPVAKKAGGADACQASGTREGRLPVADRQREGDDGGRSTTRCCSVSATRPPWAVEPMFRVTVDSVQTVQHKGKTKRFGKGSGRRDHVKKAYVCLAAGQELNFSGEGA